MEILFQHRCKEAGGLYRQRYVFWIKKARMQTGKKAHSAFLPVLACQEVVSKQ
jgi:hypothetical protein